VVIFLIFFIIISYIIISIIQNNRNFNNDQLVGSFTGTASYPGLQIFQLNITFDGNGRTNGVLYNSSIAKDFRGVYIFQVFEGGNALSFSIQTDIGVLIFNGRYLNTITGESTFVGDLGPINGTLFLSPVSI
jgi:hypothetical protein